MTAEFETEPGPRLTALAARIAAGEASALDDFWSEIETRHAPLIEPVADDPDVWRVTFLWRATTEHRNVVVAEWLTSGELRDKQMTRLPGTDVWHRSLFIRSGVLSDYQLAPDDSLRTRAEETDWDARFRNFRADPLNPRRATIGGDTPGKPGREVSLLVLPGAEVAPWLDAESAGARGTVTHHRFASATLGNERDVWLYEPATGTIDGLLVLFDGLRCLDILAVPALLDRLIDAGEIAPLAAVMIGNVDRGAELPCNPEFGRMLTEELLPWVRGRVAAPTDPARTIVGGQSYGGLAAAYQAIHHPEVFGAVLSQSGSFWWSPDAVGTRLAVWRHGDTPPDPWLMRSIAGRLPVPVRFYMDAGILENQQSPAGPVSLLQSNRWLRDVLRATGHEVTYREYAGGHDYVWWRQTLADGLRVLASRA